MSNIGAAGMAAVPTETPAVNQTEIVRNIASGVRWMRFTPGLERLFEAETGARRSRQLMIGIIPALLLFEAIVVTDFQALPDIVWPAIVLRLGAMNLVGLFALLILWRNPPPALREGVAMAVIIAQSAILMVLVALSDSAYRGHYHVGMLLGLMFGVMVLRVRFWYMLAAAVATCFLFMATSLNYSGLPQIEQQGMASVMFAATIFSMMAGYSLEREQRLTWLRSLNERLRSDRFEELSSVDPLTGLGNRRALDRAVEHVRGDRRAAASVSMALVDIDHFKAYNDAFGHVAGDDCLRRVAGLLLAEARKRGDAVFRFGGEEFVVLITGTDAAGARQACERMRRLIEADSIPHVMPRRGGRVTVSIGVASVTDGTAFDADALIFEADRQLYLAKSQGRNRISPPALAVAGAAEPASQAGRA
ncbi:MAG: GGDEF domain-containing protein [Alphaproteobacteria bacterium]|nr:GGDEF domain-containing protein [Alphaproteobacteria bacterium]